MFREREKQLIRTRFTEVSLDINFSEEVKMGNAGRGLWMKSVLGEQDILARYHRKANNSEAQPNPYSFFPNLGVDQSKQRLLYITVRGVTEDVVKRVDVMWTQLRDVCEDLVRLIGREKKGRERRGSTGVSTPSTPRRGYCHIYLF
jgi:hypothetical protein